MKLRQSIAVALGLTLAAALAQAASVPYLTGPLDPSQQLANINQGLQAVNQNVPGYGLALGSKNYLDNGSIDIIQRGATATAGASTAGCVALSYGADRWCVDTNVGSGAGYSQAITSTPSPPPGFIRSLKVYRNSGALTQKICLMQEIETRRALQLQGKTVIWSAYVQGLAGNTATAALGVTLVTGTGTDEGLGALRSAVGMTASPAITPALTGLASTAFAAATASPSWAVGTTAAWNRIYSQPLLVPATETEAVVEICTTPVGSASGATDGFAITGIQLEVVDANQTVPTAYAFQQVSDELTEALRYYFAFVETNGGYLCPGIASGTNAQTLTCELPVPMQAAPVIAVTAGGLSYRDNGVALAVSSPTLSAATETNYKVLTITDTATQTAGHTAPLYGTNTTGKLTISADF